LVIGHHPHVIQPMEPYATRGEHSRVVPILYSLGNLTPPLSHPACALSVAARIEVVRGHLDGVPQAFVSAVELVPLAAMMSTSGGGLPVLLPLVEALRERVTPALEADLGEMVSYSEQVLGPDWRRT
jgi:poly-gamma-glutamate capsule biosynthesis protein CapA/YwtB (metallophosphatase superfamily)